MPFTGGSPASRDQIFLDEINDKLSGINAKLSGSIGTGVFKTLVVDNIILSGATAPTVSTITSTSVDVRGASVVTIYYDVTGATTGLLITFRGGNSGFGMFTLRSVTASAGLGSFTVGDLTTGASADYNAVERMDDVLVQATLAANTGVGTGVTTTLRTRFLTQP